jgi:nucleoside-diphosphate-sugar epimerase
VTLICRKIDSCFIRSLERCNASRLTIIEVGDFCDVDFGSWVSYFEKVHVVIDCSWSISPNNDKLYKRDFVFLAMAARIAEAASAASVRGYVGCGSCHEYKVSETPLTVKSAVGFRNHYGIAKNLLHIELGHLFSCSATRFVWCRFFQIYGKYERQGRLYPSLVNAARNGIKIEIKNSSRILDFLEIRDACQKVEKILKCNYQGVFNICSGVGCSVYMFARGVLINHGRPDLLVIPSRPDADNFVKVEQIVGVPNI